MHLDAFELTQTYWNAALSASVCVIPLGVWHTVKIPTILGYFTLEIN